MLMSGSDALTYGAQFALGSCSQLSEVTATTVPVGHHRSGVSPAISDCHGGSSFHLAPPFKGRAVDPDAMKDEREFSRHGDLRLLRADALGEPEAPCLEGAPSFRPMQEYGGSFEEIGSQQSVAPARDPAIAVSLAGLLASWRQAEIGADFRGTTKAGRVIDSVAEGQGRDDADARDGHQTARGLVLPGEITDLAVQPSCSRRHDMH